MKFKLKIFFCFFFIFLLLDSKEEKVNFNSEQIIFNNANKSVYLIGNSQIITDSLKIFADSFLIFPDSSKLFAYRKVKMEFNDFGIEADSINFNYKKRTGLVYRGKTQIQKFQISGEVINVKNENEFEIDKGMFTTCKKDEPDYWFYSYKTFLYREDRAMVLPIVLFVKEVPLVAIPFFVIPIATIRKSGFLMPKPGYTSLDGFYIKQFSYFWATNDYSDMTFSFDYIQKRGYLFGYELRVLFHPILSLNLTSNFIFERDNKRRWNLTGDYSHKLFYDINLKSKIDFESDFSTYTDYSDTLVLRLKREAYSFVSIQKNFNFYNSFISFDRRENFATKEIRMNLPIYNGYFKKVNFFRINNFIPNGIYYQNSHSISQTVLRDTLFEKRNLNLKITNNFDTYYKILYYLNFLPNYNISFYSDSFLAKNFIDGKYSLKLNTQIYGTSIFSLKPFQKFRHTFIPEMSFEGGTTTFLKDFNSFDSLKNERKLSFSFSNIFEGKTEKEKILLLRNNVNLFYNFTKDSFSNINISNHIFPEKNISFQMNHSVNIYSKKISENYILSFSEQIYNPFNEFKRMNISVSYLLQRNDTTVSNSINGSLSLNVGENLNATFSSLYNLKDKNFVSFMASLNRSLHCWQARFMISSYANIFKYDFQISIKEIPEISIDKGIFGPLLP
ncbi:MAG: putative LPS assembly protein LptD [candidate division WOR-3 bacterium]